MTCILDFASMLLGLMVSFFAFFPFSFFPLKIVEGVLKARSEEVQKTHLKPPMMLKITTYSPDQSRTSFAFFILNKGMNSGKPMQHPCPNCFTFHASTQEEKDLYYWLCFGMWKAHTFHPYLRGSVIPFIIKSDLVQLIRDAATIALKAPGQFEKAIEAFKIVEHQEQQFHRNLHLIAEAKKIIFARYRASIR